MRFYLKGVEKIMYQVEYPANYFESPAGTTVGYCSECEQDIFEGEDVWQIKNDLYSENSERIQQ